MDNNPVASTGQGQVHEDANNLNIVHRDPPLPFVRAMHDFEPKYPQEISLRAGDKVEVIEKDDDGWWWYGCVNPKRGWFPPNHCTPIIIGYAKVLINFHTDVSTELELDQGDVIEIHNNDSPDYWQGSKGHATGWFRSSHCDMIEDEDRNDVYTPDGSEVGDEADLDRWEEETYRAGVWL